MFRKTISARLLETLSKGRKRLDDGAVERIRDFVASQRTPGGGFADKSGREDIYYTLFGWTLSRVLDMRLDAVAMRAYLDRLDPEGMDMVHYAAYARCVMLQKLAAGGRAGMLGVLLGRGASKEPPAAVEAPGGDPLSPYSRFVRLSLMEDSGRRALNRREVLGSLRDYRLPAGGYSNVRGAGEATTNATAAAMMVAGQLGGYHRGDDSRFLSELQHPSGGFGAVEGAPVPDMLSTATALFALRQYGEAAKYPAAGFVEGHWLDSGGFAATLLDTTSDVEYTFYGLLALGAL